MEEALDLSFDRVLMMMMMMMKYEKCDTWTEDDGRVVKVLGYKSEGRWFDSRSCHCNFSLT